MIDPMPMPDSPKPGFNEPDMFEDTQTAVLPFVVSASLVLPAFAVTAPPGRTVQVFAVAAADDAAPRATTAVAARTTAPILLRIPEPPPAPAPRPITPPAGAGEQGVRRSRARRGPKGGAGERGVRQSRMIRRAEGRRRAV